MLTVYQWSPLLVGLAAPLLAWLVVTSGTHTGRITRLVALAAVLAVLVQVAAVFVFVQFQMPFHPETDSYLLVYLVMRVADALATILAVAAWTLLLSASARTGNRWQLVVLTVVFALALQLESGVGQLVPFPPLQVLLQLLARLGTAGPLPPMLEVLLAHVAALAAFVCALVAPMGEVRGEPTATMRPPAPASDAPPSA